ncbi:transglycosylase domain-containing protein [Alicyclobacillus tolerans]|uniref:transglycosylase domain-containing protein n=1 Tax=Alicyclobacillus tolerans TaxID=90970 RepID=UPI001F27CDF5|nr:transglycosylase domain-containing protein [Alicyclobacillus tolerans]MCF8566747.1 transglycosylase domain-containing protein [Alicyclobacillus tolerans]
MAKKYILRIAGALLVAVIVFAAVFVALLKLVPFNSAKLVYSNQPTVIYDKNGAVFMKISAPGPSALPYQDVPTVLQNAVVATEDHTFWTGWSVDLTSIGRAAWVDLVSHSFAQGASTIQEQLAKIVYLNDQKTISRKINQILLGIQIGRHFTKQQILTMYLNRVFLGENSVGVSQAALRYFGIDLKHNPHLTLDQAALLAGLIQSPSAYDPLQHPRLALQRRNIVLQNMVKYGYISSAQAAAAAKQPLGVSFHSFPGDMWTQHPLFTNFLFDYANRHGITQEELMQGGLKVYTTIDPNVQKAIHTVFWNTNYNSDFPGPTSGTVVQGAALFVNPATGGILGAAGSREQGYQRLGLDRIYSKSSPGSSIKPVMEYGPAIQSGNWTPTSILDNTPHNFGGGYAPQNWNGPSAPKKVTLQYALQWSQNVASVWLLQQIGIQTGASFAEKDGIPLTQTDLQHLGIAIGGMQNGVDAMEMAQAYEPFDSQGQQMKAHLISKIVNQSGNAIYQFQPVAKSIMSANTAQVITSLLQDAVQYGTGQAAAVPGWGVAGKTGTVQYSSGLYGAHPTWVRNAWFDGYTPNMVGSIYLGYDQPSPQYHLTMSPDPSYNAAKIFGDIVKLAVAGQPPQQFPVGPYPAWQGLPNAAYQLLKATPQTGNGQGSNTTGNQTSNQANNTAGLNGTGNATGNVSGNATGNTPSNIPGTVPGSTTGNTTGSVPGVPPANVPATAPSGGSQNSSNSTVGSSNPGTNSTSSGNGGASPPQNSTVRTSSPAAGSNATSTTANAP